MTLLSQLPAPLIHVAERDVAADHRYLLLPNLKVFLLLPQYLQSMSHLQINLTRLDNGR